MNRDGIDILDRRMFYPTTWNALYSPCEQLGVASCQFCGEYARSSPFLSIKDGTPSRASILSALLRFLFAFSFFYIFLFFHFSWRSSNQYVGHHRHAFASGVWDFRDEVQINPNCSNHWNHPNRSTRSNLTLSGVFLMILTRFCIIFLTSHFPNTISWLAQTVAWAWLCVKRAAIVRQKYKQLILSFFRMNAWRNSNEKKKGKRKRCRNLLRNN